MQGIIFSILIGLFMGGVFAWFMSISGGNE